MIPGWVVPFNAAAEDPLHQAGGGDRQHRSSDNRRPGMTLPPTWYQPGC